MILGQWFEKEAVYLIPNVAHCLFDIGEGVWCTGEIVEGRCHTFGRCDYKHEDVQRFMVLKGVRNELHTL